MPLGFEIPLLEGRIHGLSKHDPPRAALIEYDSFDIEDIHIDLTRVVGSGGSGIVFANEKWAVKLEQMAKMKSAELDMIHWASRNGVGPRLYGWGNSYVEVDQLERILEYTIKQHFDVPFWLQRWAADVPHQPLGDIVFVITERWHSSLDQFLRDNGQDVNAFAKIPIPVMKDFIVKIEKVHNLGVVYANILPSNILVRKVNGTVTDLCLTDPGFAFPRTSWFFGMNSENRNALVRYYVDEPWLRRIADRFPPRPGEGYKRAAWRWLLYEPFHFDWLVVSIYEKLVMRNNGILDSPPYFNFQLNWNSDGILSVRIATDGQHLITQIYGLQTLASLRKQLEGKIDLEGYLFQRGYTVSESQEEEVYVSSMIDPNKLEIKLVDQ